MVTSKTVGMITNQPVGNVQPDDPNAMHAFVRINAPIWNKMKSNGKYLIPYTKRKYS